MEESQQIEFKKSLAERKEIENLSNEIKQNTDPVIFPFIEIEKIWDQFLLGHNIHYHTIHNKA